MLIVGYSRTVAAAPTTGIGVLNTWSGFSNALQSAVTFAMPGATAGNTLVAVFRVNTTTGAGGTDRRVSAAPPGWTLVAKLDHVDDPGLHPGFYIYRKTADGTEGTTPPSWTLTGGMKHVVLGWEISGDRTVTATMNGAGGDPPLHDLGSPAETVWLPVWASRRTDNEVTGVPSGYDIANLTQVATVASQSNSAADARLAGVHKIGTASSEDPGTFTTGSGLNEVQSATVGVR